MIVAVDTETTGLRPFNGDRPFMVTTCTGEGDMACYEWPVDPHTRLPAPSRRDKRAIRELTADPDVRCVFFNAKFDIFMLEQIGIETAFFGKRRKVMVDEVRYMAKLVDNLQKNLTLKHLSKVNLDYPADDESLLDDQVKSARTLVRTRKLGWAVATEETHGKSNKSNKHHKADFWILRAMQERRPDLLEEKGLSPDTCVEYAMNDAERTMMLYKFYLEGLTQLDLWEPYLREMQVLDVTMDMQRHGLAVDVRRMRKVARESQGRADHALDTMRKAFGDQKFSPTARQQVQELFFGGRPLNLKPLKWTSGGKTGKKAPSTAGEALMPYASKQPLVRSYFEHQACTKAISSFFSKYRKLMTYDEDGVPCLHPGLDQAGTLTWRYSCKEPNIQQVSSPDSSRSHTKEFMVDVRQLFVPRPGCEWFLADYSQVEVILFADIYRVETMLKAIRAGMDVHEATANRLWGHGSNQLELCTMHALERAGKDASRSAVDVLIKEHDGDIIAIEKALGQKNYRSLSKSTTFLKIYGGGPAALMGWIGSDFDTAKRVLAEYDRAFPDMVEAMAEIEHRARVDGFVLSPFGYPLAVDPWNSYRIVNHVIQHSAAALMKVGMLKCHRFLRNEVGQGARVAMTVHDELIFEAPIGVIGPREQAEIVRLMSDHEGRFSVPTPVDMERVATRWSEKEEVELDEVALW